VNYFLKECKRLNVLYYLFQGGKVNGGNLLG